MVRSLKQKILAKILPLSQFTIDVAFITLVAVITFWFAQKHDVFEYLVEVSRAHEEYEIDEILTLLMISAFSLAAITFRNSKRLKQEILRRRKAEQSIKKMAFYDSLTGLPNRELCINRFEHILNQSARTSDLAAVLFIDLDNFKEVNDNYGHDAGDILLKQFTARLLGELRKGDTLSRFAGDEFIILLESVGSINNVTILAKKILDCIQLPFQIDVNETTVGMSVDIAMYPNDGQEASILLKHADTAMYHAKNEGKNTFRFYSNELNKQARNKLIIANQLRQAISNDELTLHFQPIINVITKNVTGAEALLRWESKVLGSVPPDVFIPIAEEVGLINTIGEWVLLRACQQNKYWHNLGHNDFMISVNMSAKQLGRKGFMNVVESCLKAAELPAQFLELELTETAIMKDIGSAINRLDQLRKLGVSIALDDFGTGYSSISYLRKLQIGRIKIDRSFIQHIPENQEDIAITKAIISLARNLGLRVTAEGIETAAQQTFIDNTIVDSAQGYYIGKPMLAMDFELLFLKNKN
jgi:diguanylate cyclase (GGDEF)-like protein